MINAVIWSREALKNLSGRVSVATLEIMAASRGIRFASRALVAVVAVATSCLAPLSSHIASAQSSTHGLLPPREPTQNFRPVALGDVLALIDAARATQEELPALHFDMSRFRGLSVARQIFVLSNLERTTRGLPPAMIMGQRLDVIAEQAALRDEDPRDAGKSFVSNWASVLGHASQSAFFADFGWMYGDGPPPQFLFRNVDCVFRGQSGCWQHRDNILNSTLFEARGCPGELVSGTGFAPHTLRGPSLTQIFEVVCQSGNLNANFTWFHAVSYLKISSSQSGLGQPSLTPAKLRFSGG